MCLIQHCKSSSQGSRYQLLLQCYIQEGRAEKCESLTWNPLGETRVFLGTLKRKDTVIQITISQFFFLCLPLCTLHWGNEKSWQSQVSTQAKQLQSWCNAACTDFVQQQVWLTERYRQTSVTIWVCMHSKPLSEHYSNTCVSALSGH